MGVLESRRLGAGYLQQLLHALARLSNHIQDLGEGDFLDLELSLRLLVAFLKPILECFSLQVDSK